MGGFLLVVVVRSSPSELSIRFSAGLRLWVLWVAVVVAVAAVRIRQQSKQLRNILIGLIGYIYILNVRRIHS